MLDRVHFLRYRDIYLSMLFNIRSVLDYSYFNPPTFQVQ